MSNKLIINCIGNYVYIYIYIYIYLHLHFISSGYNMEILFILIGTFYGYTNLYLF